MTHRLTDKLSVIPYEPPTTVIVTPLQEPFDQSVMKFEFKQFDKILAVSMEDGAKIKAMLGNLSPIDREIVLSPVPGDDVRIEVSLVKQ